MTSAFLIESSCSQGHKSTITISGYARADALRLTQFLEGLTCAWGEHDGTPCGAATSHELVELGELGDVDALERGKRRAADTAPAMPAVRP